MSQVKVTVTVTIKEHEIELTLDEAKQLYDQLGYVCEVKSKAPSLNDYLYPNPLKPIVSPLNPVIGPYAGPRITFSTNNKET